MFSQLPHLKDQLIRSLAAKTQGCHPTEELLSWIKQLNSNTHVCITQTSLANDSFWFYDDYKGEVLNRKRSFFSIIGMRYFVDNQFITEQPIILQNEIGFLGILAKEIDGVLHFLMQAKIEPGNVNCVQISPTIQATKSNFTRAHGGRLPHYFEWFEQADKKGTILYDQIQSEQGSRFYGKRNRNIIVLIEQDIALYPNYKWMTLGQIKEMMKIDNLVNMDTRTVLSGICLEHQPLSTHEIISAYHLLNDYKMHHDVKQVPAPLHQLVHWHTDDNGITCKQPSDFSVHFYDIQIEGREVVRWTQPLFKATTQGTFALLTRRQTINGGEGQRQFLIALTPEIGCFDKAEFGPSLQTPYLNDILSHIVSRHLDTHKGVLHDVILSEEGGRFYHEQNRNLIIEVDENEVPPLPNHLWVSYATLYRLIQSNNVLNIQLRNLISLLEPEELH